MKHAGLLLLLVGCATEELSSTEQDLTRATLMGQGAICEQTAPGSPQWKCTKCTPVEVVDDYGSMWITVCSSYTCTDSPTSSTCVEEASYDGDLEVAVEAETTTIYGSLQRPADANASAGAYLYFAGGGSSRATFEITSAGTQHGWLRVIAPSTSANSVYIQIDGLSPVRTELPVSTAWQWVPIGASSLRTGSHDLRFYTDEVGVKIDRVLFTDNPDFIPVVQTVQAETAAIVAPMQIGTQHTIPTVGYLWVPNGAGSSGVAQFQLAMPYAGTYGVWGRFLAPTEADNSFSIGKLGEPRAVWSVPVSSSWRWHRAPITFALHDYDVLDLAQREDGTKLDKLVITNDRGFSLVEPAPPSTQ